MPASCPRLYLIDASSYLYRAFHALPPLTSPGGLPTNAIYGFTTMLLKLLRETEPDYLATVFDAPGPTFRDALYTEYKANRPGMPADLVLQLPFVHEMVTAFAICSLSIPGVEADDVIATVSQEMAAHAVNTIIVTGDKDLMQLVSDRIQLWDTMRDRRYDVAAVRERFGVDPPQVVEIMGLMGDPIDNIPGIKGIGEKTATALIQRFGSIEQLLERLVELDVTSGIRGAKKLAATLRADSQTARLSRQLALVRRDVPIDCTLERFRYRGPDLTALRALFNQLGFQRLLQDLPRSAPARTVPLQHLLSAGDVTRFLAAAQQRERIALACDAADGGPAAAQGLVAVTDEGPPAHVPLPSYANQVMDLLRNPHTEKVAHDLKRDLLQLDIPPDQLAPAFDVMVASYLLEASATHRLEDLATDVLATHLARFRGTPGDLANGVSLLLPLRDALAPRLHTQGMDRLFYEVEMPLVAVLTRMERHGIRIDVPALRAFGEDIDRRLDALRGEIYAGAGGEFNILSPTQLREVLFDRLHLPSKGIRRGKTGLSTDVDVLTRLAAAHPLPAKILDYRGLAKLKSTYIDALPAAVNQRTGRVHTSFNQTVAATGRLSSSNPNLQNIPVRGEDGRRIRAAFIADDDCVLVSADYSQIELRLLAHFSEDPALVAAFEHGEDVHTRTAADVFGVFPAAVTPDMRRTAKVINFGIIYGMGPQSLGRELAIPTAQAESFITGYFSRYAGVRAYLDRARSDARQYGYATTLLGRRRAIPDLASPDRVLLQVAERIATNTPIQGSAADVIKLAMVAIDRRLQQERLGASMISQVHDELLLEVHHADAGRTKQVVQEEMENAFALRVPLRVDIGEGRTWAEAH